MNRNSQQTPSEQEIAQFQMFLKNAKDIVCKCGNTTFVQGTKLKVVSRILTGEDRDMVIPAPQFLCSKCLTDVSFEQPQQSSIYFLIVKINTKFDLSQKVYIPDLKLSGRVLSLFINSSGLVQYNIRYFNGNESKEVYFYEDEILSEKPKEVIGLSQ